MREARRIDDSHLWELKQLWDERRRALGISEPPTDLAAIDLEVQRQRLQQKAAAIPREVRQRMTFTSTNLRLDFEFLYPAVWQVREFDREGHSEVFILGPRNRDDTYSLAITVHVFPAQEQKGKYATVAEAVEDYLRKSRRLPNFREISQAHGTLAGAEAVELAISYTIPLPPNSMNPKDTPIIERRIILKRKGRFYELIYRAVEEDYYAFLTAFKTVIHTFEFRDRRVEAREFYPLVTQVPAYAMQEQGVEHETPQATDTQQKQE
ncbi:MAG: hypothetical protein H8D78_11785 [Chloroflexi bacterium]|nr:hypothetical protein [Chloroflexota bacterium]